MIFRFFLLAYAVTWGSLLPFLLLVGVGDAFAFPLLGLLIPLSWYGPTLAGLACAVETGGRRGVRALLGRAPRVRDTGWLFSVLLGPVGVAALVTGLVVRSGTPVGPIDRPGADDVLFTFLVRILFGLGEEPGWRGFALPRLQSALPPVVAAVLLGAVRALWQLPVVRLQGVTGPGEPFATFLITGIALSVVLTWLYNRTGGSVATCVLFYASAHTTSALFERSVPLLWTNGMPDAPRAAVWTAVALFLVVVTRGRLGHRAESPAS